MADLDSSVRVHVLIRPRGGDFVYSEDEFEMMLADIEHAKRAGAHGIECILLFCEVAVECEM